MLQTMILKWNIFALDVGRFLIKQINDKERNMNENDTRAMINLLSAFMAVMPDVEKSIKTLTLSYLENYQALLTEQKKSARLETDLLIASRYIEKLENDLEKENIVH